MISNSKATIEFSAQFGGRDAAAAALDQFKALKSAAKGIALEGFPFRQLAFILRVDGDVHQFGFSGAGHPDVDSDHDYVSIDIGITEDDRGDMPSKITSSILNSLPIIATVVDQEGIDGFNVNTLQAPLELLCDRYIEGQS